MRAFKVLVDTVFGAKPTLLQLVATAARDGVNAGCEGVFSGDGAANRGFDEFIVFFYRITDALLPEIQWGLSTAYLQATLWGGQKSNLPMGAQAWKPIDGITERVTESELRFNQLAI